MTGTEFAEYIRWKTRTNSDTFTDAEIILVANVRMATMSRALMRDEEDNLIMPMHTNLIAGLREYPFPTSILSRIKYVEAKLDGVNFQHLTEFDLNQYGRPTVEADILANFSNEKGHAFYDINRKALWLYCGAITDVEAGLRLWCNVFPAKMTLSRLQDPHTGLEVDPSPTEHGFPRELHELWARGVIIDYKGSREKPIPLDEQELSYKTDLAEAIIDLKHGNMDREYIADVPTGVDNWNNGQDL